MARFILDNVTDRDLRLCLSYTVMPPMESDMVEMGTLSDGSSQPVPVRQYLGPACDLLASRCGSG
jgi:hypothetical protein